MFCFIKLKLIKSLFAVSSPHCRKKQGWIFSHSGEVSKYSNQSICSLRHLYE